MPGGPFGWFQELVGQVPEILQPLVIMLAGAVPFIEGEGSAVLGVVGGMNPVVAALAGIVGNLLCVAAVVFVGSRVREGVVGRRRRSGSAGVGTSGQAGASGSGGWSGSAGAARWAGTARSAGVAGTATVVVPEATFEPKPEKKGQKRLKRWLVRFGVPGASLLAPLALPTMFTAATLVGSGVPKNWVMLWQAVAIVLWTTVLTILATGMVSVVAS
ncbi:small multidrug efflux protein [Frigoribacterium faeni]|uniref:small multidrug efflux protein n=1 Tax=Frigoribacterium faeni TaxID=145483 RepID=UPI0011BEFB72|nr:small multidrug efflux protein [Frigoribacterium faeni]